MAINNMHIYNQYDSFNITNIFHKNNRFKNTNRRKIKHELLYTI